MEHQTVTNILDMKSKILFFLIFTVHFLSFAQENNNSKYYKLYKDGEKILRPIIYVLNDCTNDLQKTEGGEIIFKIDNQIFKYKPTEHKKNSLSLSEFEEIDFKKVKKLIDIEYQEYLNASNKIMNKKGFKPPAPINHSILKIIVVSKKGNNIVNYETDWVYSKF